MPLRQIMNAAASAVQNAARLAKYIKPVKGKKTPPAKKEKLVELDEMGGEAWGTYLYRPYVSRETEKRLKQSLRRR